MSDVLLFTASLAVTVLGLLASWRFARSRGAASGLRGAAWSLVPLGFYLTGLTGFLASLALNPARWAGVAVLGLAGVLYVVSGVKLRSRTGGPRAGEPGPRRVEAGGRPAAAPAPRGGQSVGDGMDDDMKEIEEILRRRGI
ncbi:hypothetical protein [Actinocorallia populi]|uniref:hypothetical protein n=1 Tax=Actinocorallia populi TaxID=2079200 RepID=UPI000D097AB4|nr:hypothetical protein [Actinocorallia populi]